MTSSKDVESRTLDVTVLNEPTRDLKKHVPKFLLPCPRTKEEQMYVVFEREAREYLFSYLLTQSTHSYHLHITHECHVLVSLAHNNTTRMLRKT